MTFVKIPGRFQAWSGDWRARIRDRLRARGFGGVVAFADANPTMAALEMASELSTDHAAQINYSDIAADQVVEAWRDEVYELGDDEVERFARRFLFGEMLARLSGGWRSEWRSEEARPAMGAVSSFMAYWKRSMKAEHEAAVHRVVEGLIVGGEDGTLPVGWLPLSADDPLLVEIFRRHWREPG